MISARFKRWSCHESRSRKFTRARRTGEPGRMISLMCRLFVFPARFAYTMTTSLLVAAPACKSFHVKITRPCCSQMPAYHDLPPSEPSVFLVRSLYAFAGSLTGEIMHPFYSTLPTLPSSEFCAPPFGIWWPLSGACTFYPRWFKRQFVETLWISNFLVWPW